MAGTIAPFPKHMFFTNAGAPAAGYYLHTTLAGTTTQVATYTDVDLSVPNANPIVLDASGRATIFLTPGVSYKFALALSTDSTPPASAIWTQDNISAVPPGSTSADVDATVTAGEAISSGDLCYVSDGSGGLTGGRAYKTDSDQTYSSVGARVLGFATAAISSGASGTIRTEGRVTGLSGLVAGTAYYVSATAAGLTSTAPTNARAVGIADSTTSIIIAPWAGTVSASASEPGLVNLTTQTLGAGTKSVDKLTYKPGAVTTFDANASGRILGPYVTSRDTSTTTETSTIATAPTIKANTLNASGDVLRATYVGIASANAQVTTWRVKLGGTTISTFQITTNATAASWVLTVEIHRTGAATQNISSTLRYSEAAATSTSFVDVQAGTKDLTTDLALDVTMQRAVAGTVTFKGAWYEVIGL